MTARRINKASRELQRLMIRDCRRCCQPANHHGDCCALCLERAQPAGSR